MVVGMVWRYYIGHQRWAEANHPLLNFFCYIQHPDIDVRPNPEPQRGGLFPVATDFTAHRPSKRRSV
jgi:hypothetical protein